MKERIGSKNGPRKALLSPERKESYYTRQNRSLGLPDDLLERSGKIGSIALLAELHGVAARYTHLGADRYRILEIASHLLPLIDKEHDAFWIRNEEAWARFENLVKEKLASAK